MPVLFFRTGRPSSADVPSIVYARQRHSRTARFQSNVVTDLERSCHSQVLADPTPCRSVPLARANDVAAYACLCDAAR